MKKNSPRRALGAALLLGGAALAAELSAGSAATGAQATVRASVAISIVAAPDILVDPGRFLAGLSPSGPLLRGGPATAAPGADTHRLARHYLSVSGEPGLTYAVSQGSANIVHIEYN